MTDSRGSTRYAANVLRTKSGVSAMMLELMTARMIVQRLLGQDKEHVTVPGLSLEAYGSGGDARGAARPSPRGRAGAQRSATGNSPRFPHGGLVQRRLPVLRDLIEYLKVRARVGTGLDEFESLFTRFLAASVGGNCLHLRFDSDGAPQLGANWLTLTLNHVEQRARERGVMSIDVDDACCDAIFCAGLGRASQPGSLIAEIGRMLKSGGQLWVQTPLCCPYPSASADAQPEYWRFTPCGLQMLLQDFDEILCSVYMEGGSALRAWSYFYGIKPSEHSGGFSDLRLNPEGAADPQRA